MTAGKGSEIEIFSVVCVQGICGVLSFGVPFLGPYIHNLLPPAVASSSGGGGGVDGVCSQSV